jgi:hypothetical protein
MKVPQGELLLELAALIERHPSQDWMKLAVMIEEEKSRSQIVSFLKGLSTLREALSRPGPSLRTERRAKTKAKETGIERQDSIGRLEQKLAHAPISDLRELALKARLRVSPKDSKKRLIERILRNSRGRMSPAERKGSSIASGGKRNDYGQWARIILGKTDKSRAGK